MTELPKKTKDRTAGKKRPKVERLELDKETIQGLTGEKAEAARGGAAATGSNCSWAGKDCCGKN